MIMLIDEKNYVDKAENVIDKLSHIQKTRNGKRLVDKAGNPVYEDMMVLCQDLVQVKMRNFFPF